ncbi:MAG TPA: hypothetical protein VN884_04455 [Candidatus Sulfotelmatobacter sp.]|nr:hypothetical protein [Candidatus Sulfotelmatobacter sp.]
MKEEIDFLREHLKMECKRLRALGHSEMDIEAKLSVSPHTAHSVVVEEFNGPAPVRERSESTGAIEYKHGK